ncbi:hypothetical protein [Nesterenkonia pannonica]|uniref:hypothetical protein n=1 Tax=Nesterenkonia pannonica TaxID=1548602 RepID=UPI00216478C0|nr:hypothetical protein [Nesterenkonia pannonica]
MTAQTMPQETTTAPPVVKIDRITKGFPNRKKGFQRIVAETNVDIQEGNSSPSSGPPAVGSRPS